MNNRHNIEMTSGALIPELLAFAIPLIFTGMLQQSFVAVDVAAIGKFSTSQAVAAVGSNGPLVNIMVNLFVGISIGANVVIARFIGSRNPDGIRRAISTTVSLSFISGIVLLFAGLILSRPILEWMNTPDDVIDLAAEYLGIYFLGMPVMMIYNFCAAIMRSMGDTRRPLYALMIAAALNIALDILLSGAMHMGVKGVAIGTVASQFVSSGCVLWWLMHEQEPYRLSFRRLNIYGSELMETLKIGVPAGMQGMIFSFANLFIQSAVNSFGSAAMAGSSIALTYEAYCYFIIAAFSQAATAFVSQNYGAHNFRRCRQVVWKCMLLSVGFMILVTEIIGINATECIRMFSSDPEVVEWGVKRVHCVLMFQAIACSYEICGSAMRGLGNSLTPMLLTVFGTCVLRLIWIFTVSAHYHTFEMLFIVYPLSWLVTGIMVVVAYRRMAARCLRPDDTRLPVMD